MCAVGIRGEKGTMKNIKTASKKLNTKQVDDNATINKYISSLEQFRQSELSQISYYLSVISSNIVAILNSKNKAFIDTFLASAMENIACLQEIVAKKTQQLFQ